MKRYIKADIVDVADEDDDYRRVAAVDVNTRIQVLIKLSNDPDWVVRSNVAFNPNTPKNILAKLAEDDSEDVRVCVAQNPSTPEDILRVLCMDTDWFTRHEALKNLYGDLYGQT